MQKLKILFYATSPDQNTGYSKIGNILSNYLVEHFDIYYMAIGKQQENIINDRYIHPDIKFIDVNEEERKRNLTIDYGMELINQIMSEINPDIFFVYNDIIVTCRLYNALLEYRSKNKTKFVVYLDLVYPYEKYEYIKHIDRNSDLIYVFSECWKENLLQHNINEEKIKVLHHGINTNIIKKMSKSEARETLGLKENDFIILNANRNCYRKATDITIRSFIHFFKKNNMNPNIKLFLNMYLNTKTGYDIYNLLLSECIKQNIDINILFNQIITHPANSIGQVSDHIMNCLYNACDVGINTAIGEGFGLCNFEHGYLEKPQVISAVGAIKDIFSNDFSYLVEPVITISAAKLLDDHGGDLSYCSYIDVSKGIQFYYDNPEIAKEHGLLTSKHILTNFMWNDILKQLVNDLKNLQIL